MLVFKVRESQEMREFRRGSGPITVMGSLDYEEEESASQVQMALQPLKEDLKKGETRVRIERNVRAIIAELIQRTLPSTPVPKDEGAPRYIILS